MKCPKCGSLVVGEKCMYCGITKDQDITYQRIKAQNPDKVHMTISGDECVEITALEDKVRRFLMEDGRVICIAD